MSKARDLANAGTALTTVSATELGYLDGVTSAVQTQINAQIPKTIVDAKGDLIAATASDTVSRLAVGTDGQFLSADSTAATGLAWVAGGGSTSYSLLNAGGTALTGATTVTVSGISGIQKLYILITGVSAANNYAYIGIRLNGDTGSNYRFRGQKFDTGVAYFVPQDLTNDNILIGRIGVASDTGGGSVFIDGCKSSGLKIFEGSGNFSETSYISTGYYNSTSTISSVSVVSFSGNLDAGTVYVYGSTN